uniref:DUF659 domain-containing protein n=1 Tax=Esox lucius TaxID=8010 RepID=A0AAY5K050_ESOLU
SPSNLSKHLASSHRNVKLAEKTPEPPTDMTAEATSEGPSPAKQVKIDLKTTELFRAVELNKRVAGYIVENILPISTVDSESFRRIIEKIQTKHGVKLLQRKSFAGYLEREYDIMDANLKAALGDVDFVANTADIWTVNNKFYGCNSRHTYDVIGAEIEEIHSSYGLHGKVVATVTDNASNFGKAFRVCQPCNLESESENEEGDDDEEPTFTDVIETLSTASGDGQFSLPRHHRCASHTSSSSSSSSAYPGPGRGGSSLILQKASEQVEEVSRRKLMVPTSTRWNSLYKAISRIIPIPMNELNPLCVKLGIKCLNEREYIFLQEYCTVMKPMTVALDILQGDECTYGALLPTLTCLMSKTLALKDDLSRMTASLPDVTVKAIKIRFHAVLESREGHLAAATCPKFKLRCVVKLLLQLTMLMCPNWQPAQLEIDFIDFENQPTERFSAENEVADYLRSGYELEILNQFPNLKKMYMKYNTPTPITTIPSVSKIVLRESKTTHQPILIHHSQIIYDPQIKSVTFH